MVPNYFSKLKYGFQRPGTAYGIMCAKIEAALSYLFLNNRAP